MKEFIEKVIGRLEEEVKSTREMQTIQCVGNNGYGTPLQAKISGEISALLKTINIVNQLAEEHNNGWIPCSERLPEINQTVLVTDKTYVTMANFLGDAWEKPGYTYLMLYDVIAWQPLPEPYKEVI